MSAYEPGSGHVSQRAARAAGEGPYAPALPFPTERVVVRFDRVYGKVLCYPVSSGAHKIAALARTKTLSPAALTIARDLGLPVSLAPGSQQVLEEFLAGRT